MMVAEKVTPRRYIDWAITTPTMLFTTIVYLDYIHKKEKGEVLPLQLKNFIIKIKMKLRKCLFIILCHYSDS